MHFSPPGERSKKEKVMLYGSVEVCRGEDSLGGNTQYTTKVKQEGERCRCFSVTRMLRDQGGNDCEVPGVRLYLGRPVKGLAVRPSRCRLAWLIVSAVVVKLARKYIIGNGVMV